MITLADLDEADRQLDGIYHLAMVAPLPADSVVEKLFYVAEMRQFITDLRELLAFCEHLAYMRYLKHSLDYFQRLAARSDTGDDPPPLIPL